MAHDQNQAHHWKADGGYDLPCDRCGSFMPPSHWKSVPSVILIGLEYPIHQHQAVASTFNQCKKYLDNGVEGSEPGIFSSSDLVIAMIDIEGGLPWIVILIRKGLMEWPWRSCLLTMNPRSVA